MEKEDIVWVDVNGNGYCLTEIDNRYLLNILNFIAKGGGYTKYITEEKIKKLLLEADKRGLKHKHKIKNLINSYHAKLFYECCYEDWF